MTTQQAIEKINAGAKLTDTQAGYRLVRFSQKANCFLRIEVPMNIARALIRRGIEVVREERTWELYGVMAK